VQTTSDSDPSFTPASTLSRTSRSIDPWCSARRSAHSGFAFRISANQRSACERVFVKSNVETFGSSHSRSGFSIARPRCPDHGKRSMRAGIRLSTITGRSSGVRNTVAARPTPTTCRAARSGRASVAESAHVRRPGAKRRSRASASSTCAPRLFAIISCHSSTMTARVPAKASRASA
jgi:hypothetical protein